MRYYIATLLGLLAPALLLVVGLHWDLRPAIEASVSLELLWVFVLADAVARVFWQYIIRYQRPTAELLPAAALSGLVSVPISTTLGSCLVSAALTLGGATLGKEPLLNRSWRTTAALMVTAAVVLAVGVPLAATQRVVLEPGSTAPILGGL